MRSTRSSICALSGAAVLALGLTAIAESPSATVLLKSGERVHGSFEDIQNNTVYLRTGQHDERRISVNDVAIIDFVGGTRGLPETELSQARGNEDFLLLKSGQGMKGNFVDVHREGEGGERTMDDAQVKLIFEGSSGRQEIPIGQVTRLYFGPLPDLNNVEGALAQPSAPQTGASTAASADAAVRTLTVPANQQWTGTGIFVRSGQQVAFNGSGEIRTGEETATVAGITSARKDARAPLPDTLAGALLGRVGNSQPFGIGNTTSQLTMPASGELFLGINESQAGLSDNSGHFTVEIRPEGSVRIR